MVEVRQSGFLKSPSFLSCFFFRNFCCTEKLLQKASYLLPQICFLGSSVLREKWGHESSVWICWIMRAIKSCQICGNGVRKWVFAFWLSKEKLQGAATKKQLRRCSLTIDIVIAMVFRMYNLTILDTFMGCSEAHCRFYDLLMTPGKGSVQFNLLLFISFKLFIASSNYSRCCSNNKREYFFGNGNPGLQKELILQWKDFTGRYLLRIIVDRRRGEEQVHLLKVAVKSKTQNLFSIQSVKETLRCLMNREK